MTEDEESQIRDVIRSAPRSIWGYLVFVFPSIIVVVGIAFQIALLAYFKDARPDIQFCVMREDEVHPLEDSELARNFVLTTSALTILTFGFLAVLARRAFRQVRLLKAAARDLGIDDDQRGFSMDGRTSHR